MAVAKSLRAIFLGAPISADHQVDAYEACKKLEEIELTASLSGLSYMVDEVADLPTGTEGQLAMVLDDGAASGAYRKGASTWAKTGELPAAFSDAVSALLALGIEETARIAADAALLDLASAGDPVRLSYVSGGGQAATYEVVAAQAALTLGVGQPLQFAWQGANTATDPTLTIGATTYTLRAADGGALAADDLRASSYFARIHTVSPAVIRVLTLTRVADVPGLGGALADAVQDAAEAQNTADDAAAAAAVADGKAVDAQATADDAVQDAAALLALASAGDPVRLSYVSGDGQAATYEVVAAQAALTLGVGQPLQFAWQAANTATDPTLTIGATTYTLRAADGGALAADDLRASSYFARIHTVSPAVIRVLTLTRVADVPGLGAALSAEAAARSEADTALDEKIDGETQAREDAENLGSIIRMVDAVDSTGVGNVVVAQIEDAQSHITQNVNQRVQVYWPTTNTGSATLNGLSVRRRDGSAVSPGDLLGGSRLDLVVQSVGPIVYRLMNSVALSDINGLDAKIAEMEALKTAAPHGENAPSIGLLDGKPVRAAVVDPQGRLLHYQSDAAQPVAREYRMASSGNVAVNLDQTVVYIIAILGQSNGQAHNEGTGDTLVATSSIYPDHALMLRGGPRSGMRQTDLATRAGRLVPAVESVNDIFRETRASSAATHLIRAVDDAVSFKPKVAVYVPAIGGQTYANLKRGRPSYTRFINGLQDMATAIRAQGNRPVLLAVNWVGNESDLALDPAIIARNQLQSRRQIAEDVRRIIPDQVEDVIYVLDAVGRANSVYAPNTQTGAEIAAATDPHIILGSPCYQLSRAVGQEIHLDSLGQNNAGQALARVIMAEAFGTGWVPFTPRRVWRSGASEIKAIIPCPSGNLTLDTSGTVVDVAALPSGNHLGFVFTDGVSGSAITGATISGNEVTFTLSSAPTGYSGTLVYATQRNVSESRDGPTYGARGALRGSVGEVNAYTAGTQYDWCLPFIRHFAL